MHLEASLSLVTASVNRCVKLSPIFGLIVVAVVPVNMSRPDVSARAWLKLLHAAQCPITGKFQSSLGIGQREFLFLFQKNSQ